MNRRRRRRIAAVQKAMDKDALEPALFGKMKEGVEVLLR
jgi:hypothetical protein